jgi:flagellar L-ring protein precursor FlgH
MKTKFISTLILLILALLPVVADVPAANEQQKKNRSEKESRKEKKRRKSADAEAAVTLVRDAPQDSSEYKRARNSPDNGSLYSDNAINSDLLSDFRARRAGDLIFVDVIETSTASVSSGAKRSRDSGNLGGFSDAVGNLPGASAATVARVLGAMGTRQYEGQGATQRTSRLQARIAARVIEVLPNGDLLIEARKLVRINREDEVLRLSGLVRQRDVTADNAIPTTSVGNLFVELNGKGIASADNAPGWLYRLFEKISPF